METRPTESGSPDGCSLETVKYHDEETLLSIEFNPKVNTLRTELSDNASLEGGSLLSSEFDG